MTNLIKELEKEYGALDHICNDHDEASEIYLNEKVVILVDCETLDYLVIDD